MGRTPCCEKEGLKKGPWTTEEDQKLIDYIQQHGHRNWRTLPKNAGLQRCGKSCRLRWTNYLRPDIKRGRFSFEEEQTIIHLHSILGNKWSAIAARLPGRTDNEIKNYWNTHIRKRLLRNGIDPVTHAPRLDLFDLSSILNSSPTSYANISRLIGLQQLVNPDVLKLAASLFTNSSSSSRATDLQSSMQSQQLVNPIPTDLIQTAQLHQFQPQLTNSTPCVPIASFEAHNSLDGSNNFDQLYSSSSNMIDLGFDARSFEMQTQLMDAWQGNGMTNDEGHLPDLLNLDFIQQNGCDASYINGLYDSDNSTFQSDNPSFSFSSILSTPSSLSPTPLNSNSNSMGITTEDERESYSSTLMKFEIPTDHYLDVNEFMV